MKLENVKLSLYKYRFKSLVLKYGSGDKAKTHEVPHSLIARISLNEEFEIFYFPFFTIDISVPTNIYRSLVKPANKNKLKATLTLQKGTIKEAVSIENPPSSFKKCFSGTFKVIIGSDNVDTSVKEQKLVEKSDNEYGQLTTISMLLYNNQYFSNYDRVINACLKGPTLAEALTFCLNSAGIGHVLCSPPTNYKTYEQFILTPIPLCEQITRICNNFGIHNKGSLIYFGIDRAYIVDKIPKCTAYENGEFKITYIVTSTESQAAKMTGGAHVDKSKEYFVVNASDISYDNKRSVTEKAVGTNTVSVNSDGGITRTNDDATKVTNVVMTSEGSTTPSAIRRNLSESKKVVTCQFKDVDISMLTVNKQFIVSIEGGQYKKYNGKYRMTSANHVFEKEGDYFRVTTIARFTG